MMKRRVTKTFCLVSRMGHLYPVSVQSMTNTHTANVAATIDRF